MVICMLAPARVCIITSELAQVDFPGRVFLSLQTAEIRGRNCHATIPQIVQPYAGQIWMDVNRLAASPDNPNLIYAATDEGIQITHDGGNTWNAAKISSPFLGQAQDIKVGSDGFVYACFSQSYYHSVVAEGDSFELRSGLGGFPLASFSRLEFAVAPSNPKMVYVAAASTNGACDGVWQSTDGGINWVQIGPANAPSFNPLGNQGDYDLAFNVLPSDSNTVFFGGQLSLYRYRSTDGWVELVNTYAGSIAGWIIHPDLHTIAFNPFDTKQMAIGCDGGIYMTDDDEQNYPVFYDANRNYRVTQMYSVAAAYTGETMGGTQDNGTPYMNFLGNSPLNGIDITGGDGGYTFISHANPDAFFGGNPGGVLFRSANKGQAFSCFFDTRIDGNQDCQMDENAEFVTPFTVWENEDGSIAFYATGGDRHAWITPQALNFSTDADWFQLSSQGSSTTCIQFTPDGNTLFVGTSGGVLYRYSGIYDAYVAGKFKYASISSPASSWVAADSGIKISSYLVGSGRYLHAIAIDPANPENIVVTAGNYGNTEYVWRSTNALDSLWNFSDITGDLIKAPVYGAAIDPYHPNNLIVGTEFGVWSSDLNNPGIWSEENANGMSRVPTLMVHFINFENINYLYIGTHGRGIFRSGTLAGVVNGVNTPNANLETASIFPSPVQHQATLSLSLHQGSDVSISIYNLEGKLMQQQSAQFPAGVHSSNINTDELPSGTYLVNIHCGNDQWTKKLVVIH